MLSWMKWWNRRVNELPVQLFCRYTDRARKLMSVANQYATARGCEEISTEHLLMALIGDEVGMGVGKGVLACRGVDFARMGERLGVTRSAASPALRKLHLRASAKEALQRSIEESREMGDDYVGTEHILQALSLVEGTREVLVDFGANHAVLRAGVHMMRAQVAQREGKIDKAKRELAAALSHETDASAMNDAAWVLATSEKMRDGPRATALAKKACEASNFSNASHLDTLAAAYAANGEFEKAVRAEERVLAMKPEVEGATERLGCYQVGKAWMALLG